MSGDATTMAYNILGYTKTVNMTLRRIGTESGTTEKKTGNTHFLKTISKNSTGNLQYKPKLNLTLHTSIDSCFFNYGYMQGAAAKYVSKIDDEDNCAIQAKVVYPGATGATWNLSFDCWAEFGEYMTHTSSHRTCRFQGNLFK